MGAFVYRPVLTEHPGIHDRALRYLGKMWQHGADHSEPLPDPVCPHGEYLFGYPCWRCQEAVEAVA